MFAAQYSEGVDNSQIPQIARITHKSEEEIIRIIKESEL